MIYSELIEKALFELNISKAALSRAMGISVTTLNRILSNESPLPTTEAIERLAALGVDVTELDYNEIYYEYISKKFEGEYIWKSDAEEDGNIELYHKKCKTQFYINMHNIGRNKILRPFCREEKAREYHEKYQSTHVPPPRPVPRFEYDSNNEKHFEIYDNLLWKCYKGSREKFVVTPDGVTIIGRRSFHNCKKIKEIRLSDDVIKIGESAFSGCEKLDKIYLSKNLEIICDGAFNFTKIRELQIPAKVRYIHHDAFEFCDTLVKITVEPGNTCFKIIDNCLVDLKDNSIIKTFTPLTEEEIYAEQCKLAKKAADKKYNDTKRKKRQPKSMLEQLEEMTKMFDKLNEDLRALAESLNVNDND